MGSPFSLITPHDDLSLLLFLSPFIFLFFYPYIMENYFLSTDYGKVFFKLTTLYGVYFLTFRHTLWANSELKNPPAPSSCRSRQFFHAGGLSNKKWKKWTKMDSPVGAVCFENIKFK